MDITQVAHLARLQLTEDEAVRFQEQLDLILEDVKKLESVDVSGIEPTAHASPLFDVLREDAVHGDSFTSEQALANAPDRSRDQFKVVKVVE